MFLKSIFQAVPEAFWVFWIPAMQCKNGAKDINLCCKSWPKENLFTDFCPRPLMKICQKTINHTLRTQCQGKDIDFLFKRFFVVNHLNQKKTHNFLDPDNLKKFTSRFF